MKKRLTVSIILLVVIGLFVYTLMNRYDPEAFAEEGSWFYKTPAALVPPLIAILLALITKEVYSSLFVGIISGALLYSNFNLECAVNSMFFNEDGGMLYKIADSFNVGILVFLVLLGILVALMNKAGGSVAFGNWASKHIKTRVGAQLATVVLGMLIFVDDYFNCLTVGSVMRPVTDTHKVSRAKLAYIIDATAAPICIIAPISSWAAAVTSSVPDDSEINGFSTFINTIPYNYYAILTLVMMFYMILCKVDFGPMKRHEINAIKGDLFTTGPSRDGSVNEFKYNEKGIVLDLVLPVIVLIVACILGMVYTGGFFDGVDFITAFADADASVGLVLGGFVAVLFTFFYYMLRNVLSFREFMEAIPEGFRAMVAPILILVFAWTLSGMTNLLGAKFYVADLVSNSAPGLQSMLPAVIFLVALGLSFSTGTSWGTFGILIPIVIGVFPHGEMMTISISACLAGAVCGDHCSPISDTTIMASAGAECYHINHVSTQLPYALACAAVSCVTYIITGFIKSAIICLPIGIIMMLGVMTIINMVQSKKQTKEE